MQSLYLTVLLLFSQTPRFPADSLLAGLQNARSVGNLPAQGRYLNAIAYAHYALTNYDSAKNYYYQALAISRSLGNDTLVAQNTNDLGMTYYKLGALDSCIQYYKKSLSLYSKIGHTQKEAIIALNLSMIYNDKGGYEKALEIAMDAAPKLAQTNSMQALGSCYNTIALIYSRLSDLGEALAYHKKALDTRLKINNTRGIAQSYNNIANVYKNMGVLDSAVVYYNIALELKKKSGDIAGSASTLNNLGEVMIVKGQLSNAEDYLLRSLEIKQQSGNVAGQVYTITNLAMVALKQNRFNVASRYLDESEKLARDLGLLAELRRNYEVRIELLENSGNIIAAFPYSKKLLALKDSIFSGDMAESLAGIQTVYETEQKEQQILLLEKDKNLQRAVISGHQRWLRALAGAGILAMIIIGLLYRQYQHEQRTKKNVQLLLRELHHRVKNNLQILSSVLSLQSLELTDESALAAVRSSEDRVNAMALIHRKLYGEGINHTVNIKEYVTELIRYLAQAYGHYGKKFELQLSLEPVVVNVDKAIPLGLVMNELISNAFKHAYADHPTPRLSVNVERIRNERLQIDIADNGNGFHSKGNNNSFGLKLVNILMSDLNGTYEVNTDAGTKYQIIIPI